MLIQSLINVFTIINKSVLFSSLFKNFTKKIRTLDIEKIHKSTYSLLQKENKLLLTFHDLNVPLNSM